MPKQKAARGARVLLNASETRLSMDHMATSMYAERVKEDTKKGRGEMFTSNPDARALYFKGVNDVLRCMREWQTVAPELLAQFMCALHDQTVDAVTGPTN